MKGLVCKRRVETPVPKLPTLDHGDMKFSLLPSVSSASRSASAALLAASLIFSPLQQLDTLLPVPFRSAPAFARELSSGSGSRVNKDPNSLLRLGLPNQPKGLRDAQLKIEEAADGVTRLTLLNAGQALNSAKGLLSGQRAAILKSVPDAASGEKLFSTIESKVSDASSAITKGEATVAGKALESALLDVSALEELIATTYKQAAPPAEFANLPWLKGRATVSMELKRPDGKFNVQGDLYDKLQVSMVVDGYTSPITAGNFVDLVDSGFYNNFKIQRSDGFVVQTGDPQAEGRQKLNGFVPAGASEVRKIPLEVMVAGDKGPIYGATFDDDGRGGYAAALPFNAYGALGMAREEVDLDSASSQWFWLLFDSDLTPAGKNLLDGRYACFGYTVDGARLLSDVKEGDVIVSAKVTSGLENLQRPAAPVAAAAPADS